MQKYADTALGGTPLRALAGATVTVRDSGGSLAALFSDDGVTTTGNPVTAGVDGEFEFYAANGRYNITISATGYQDDLKSDILLYDAGDATFVTSFATLSDKATADIPATNDATATALAGKVPTSRTINGHDLTADVSLSPSDIGALASSSVVNDLTTGGTAVPLSAEMGKSLQTTKLPTSSVVNDLTSGGIAVPLSAEMGKSLQTAMLIRAMFGSGSPNGVVTGTAGALYIQKDAPYPGALYNCTSGTTWTANTDNIKTLATLPTASSSNVGAIYTVTDAVTIDGIGTVALDLLVKQYGASYYWVAAQGFWPIYRNRTLSSAVTGGTTFTQTATFTFPNRADMFPPIMDMWFEMHSVITSHGGAGTVNQVIQSTTGPSIIMNQQIASGGTSAAQRTILRVSAVGSQFQLPTASGTGGYSTSTGADLTWSLTLPGLVWQFGLTPSNAADSSKVRQADITFWYA